MDKGKESPEGSNVRDLTPILVNSWARTYIKKYTTEGSEEAKKWALRFLKGPNMAAMAAKVNELLKKGNGNG